jgi:hypothetical protein
MVIVTTDALAASWQVLADWKTRRGIPTVVRTVEWIQANYRRGSDLQESIRTFVKDAYAKWAVQYVLLGGDTDILPARYGYSAFGSSGDQFIPSDLYFGCLDGNWNKDGDAVWGEAAPNVSDPGDSTDFYAEVYVGRLPMSTTAEVNAMVAKEIVYENPTQTTYQNKMLLLGEVLMPVNWDSSQTITMDGADLCENLLFEVGGCTVPKRLYENPGGFPGSFLLTRQATIDEMNAGYGFVNHVGHGYRYNMSCGDASLQNFHATSLTNGDKRFVLYMLNCTATAFDYPCLAEAFLDAAGGAVAVLGASRSAFSLPSHVYNRNFIEAAYQQGYTNLGQIFAQSRLPQTPNAWQDTADHYSHLIYAFLGDPETVLHTCTLGTTAATFPSLINLGTTNITVNVTVDGQPRPARASVTKGKRGVPVRCHERRRQRDAALPRRDRRSRAGDRERPEHEDVPGEPVGADRRRAVRARANGHHRGQRHTAQQRQRRRHARCWRDDRADGRLPQQRQCGCQQRHRQAAHPEPVRDRPRQYLHAGQHERWRHRDRDQSGVVLGAVQHAGRDGPAAHLREHALHEHVHERRESRRARPGDAPHAPRRRRLRAGWQQRRHHSGGGDVRPARVLQELWLGRRGWAERDARFLRSRRHDLQWRREPRTLQFAR